MGSTMHRFGAMLRVVLGGSPAPAAPDLSGSSLSIANGSFTGGDYVVVTGATGVNPTDTLTLGGVDTPFFYISPTSFGFATRRIAVGLVGAKDLTLTNSLNQSSTKASAFTYTAQALVPAFTSMAALDAAITDVGQIADLIGATTGAPIGRIERMAVGARGLRFDQLDLDQADGTELDGDFAPLSLGAAAPVTWGISGARGMILPAGTITLPGWRYVFGDRMGLTARVEGWATPGTPANHDCLAMGVIRDPSNAIATAFGGGIGYNATPARRAALISAGTLDLPTGIHSGTAEAGLSNGAVLWLGMQVDAISSVGQGRYQAGYWSAGVSTGGMGSPGTAFQTDIVDFQPAFMRRGDWGAARITRLLVGRRLP